MITDPRSYGLFFKFIETYAPGGFHGINPDDSFMFELEEVMKNRNQFFYVGDIIRMKIIYTSSRSIQMIGIVPDELTPYHFYESVHPDDSLRHGLGTAQLFKMANELFIDRKGVKLLSTNLRIRNSLGHYSNLFIQCFLFYRDFPIKTVYLLQIQTDIDSVKKIKNRYHYYVGDDVSNLRYPDDELLLIGNYLSDREIEIVKLIERGLSSEQISTKLFLSIHTVNTHRRNVLVKTGKAHISEVIYDLKEQGLL